MGTMALSDPKLCTATMAQPDSSRHTWASTAEFGCFNTSTVDHPISGCDR